MKPVNAMTLRELQALLTRTLPYCSYWSIYHEQRWTHSRGAAEAISEWELYISVGEYGKSDWEYHQIHHLTPNDAVAEALEAFKSWKSGEAAAACSQSSLSVAEAH